MRRFRVSVGGLMAVVFIAAVGLGSLRFAEPVVAGLMLLLTLAVMGWAVLNAVLRRGHARAFWLGFALFGGGYLALAAESWWGSSVIRPELATTVLLDRLYPVFDPEHTPAALSRGPLWLRGQQDPQTEAILAALDRPLPMPFARRTPLEDVIKSIKSATTGPILPEGIPIYIDPIGLQEANVSASSPIRRDVEGGTLGVTFDLVLKQLGLGYSVRDGMMTISYRQSNELIVDAFRRAGHALFALMAGAFGGIAGRLVHGAARRDEAGSA